MSTSTNGTDQAWSAVKKGPRSYNVESDGIRYLSHPCDRWVHAQMLAKLVSGIFRFGPPKGMMTNGELKQCLALRAAFERFASRDRSRSLIQTCTAWNAFLHRHQVWCCTADDGLGRFECRPVEDNMLIDRWVEVTPDVAPKLFGDIPRAAR